MFSRRAALTGALALGIATPAQAAPRRVVSLNPCLDAILVHVADRGQIAALSHYARTAESSTIADLARSLPMTHESAEEVLALSPDLVLASAHSAIATRSALAQLNIRVADFTVPNSVDESIAQIAQMAALLDRPQRGEALIASIRAALARATPRTRRAPIDVLVFQPRGLAAGTGTLVDEMLVRTGFANAAARYGINRWGNVSLERLIADPPALLLSGQAAPGAPTWSERLITHPALAAIAPRMKRDVFPEAFLYCGGPVLLQTAPTLAAARERFWSGA